MTDQVGIQYGSDGAVNMVGSNQDWLLRIDSWPPKVTLSPEARVCVKGQVYYVWHETDEKRRVSGGSVLHLARGESFYIADLLKEGIPSTDPRWSDEYPVPFWKVTPLKLSETNLRVS